jgi:hypothetical protein
VPEILAQVLLPEVNIVVLGSLVLRSGFVDVSSWSRTAMAAAPP